MNIKFREMNIGDKSEVIAMMRSFYNTPAVYTNGSEEIYLNDFNGCVSSSPFLEGYIFESDGYVCGYSMLAKSFSTEFGKPCVWVEDLYIKKEHRGMGIGSKFFDFIAGKYTDVIFRLEVEKENSPAIRLYTKKRFKPLPYLEMKYDPAE